jgi:hypothetical protein
MFILILPYLFQRKPQQLLDRLHYLVGDIVGVVNLYLVIHDKIGVSILSPCNAFAFLFTIYTNLILSPDLGLLPGSCIPIGEKVGYLGGFL